MVFQDPNPVNTFFSLLRSGMYGIPVPPSQLPAAIDWKGVVALAKKHVVLGIIIDSIQFLPPHLRPSAPLAAKLNKFALGLIQTNLILEKRAARLVAFLREHGIPGVLLKGQGIARCYRMPQMRQSGDVDFYVGKEYYGKAVSLCKRHLTDGKDSDHETDQHFGFDMEGVPIEIHRLASKIYSPFRKKRFQDWIVEELEHSPARRTLTIGGTDITLPSLDFDAIFIFYHAWRHYIMGGIGVRQLCDWAMIFHTHAGAIDTKRLAENIERFGMTKGWKLFACIAVDHLGLPEDKIPLYDPAYRRKSEKILEEIIEGGNFGYYSKAYRRSPGLTWGLKNGMKKFGTITGYFLSIFPIVPVEATFLYISRLYYGTMSFTKRSIRNL